MDCFEEFFSQYKNTLGVVTIDKDGCIVKCNQSYLDIIGCSEEDVVGHNIIEFDCYLANNCFAEIQNTQYGNYDSCFVKKDGEISSIEVIFFHQEHTSGQISLGIKNLTHLKKLEYKLFFLSKIFQTSNEAIFITDEIGNILCANASFERITGYSSAEVVGKSPDILNSGKHNNHFYQKFWQELINKGSWKGEIWNRRKNGQIYPEWLNVSSVKNEKGEITHYVSQFTDISTIKKSQEEQKIHTYYDPLTCLPNRTLLFEKLKALRDGISTDSKCFSILFCDLDDFKSINDTYGHHVGDELLKCIANRLGARLRGEDIFARSGDDEFIIAIKGESAVKNIDKITLNVLSVFDQPFKTNYGDFKVSMSIGVSLFPLNSHDIHELISFADFAMQKVKRSGGNHYAIFEASAKEQVKVQHLLEQDIKFALDRDEFEVWFQPQVDSYKREVFGVECLLRWHHPVHGIISPTVFIPILEANALIRNVGDFVIRAACNQMKIWKDNNNFNGIVAVNVSLRQLESEGFVDSVKTIFEEYRIDSKRIEFEVTESLFSDNRTHLINTLYELRDLGVKISIDDFGTGYSSLQRLKLLPVDCVKIDKCFVDNVVNSELDTSIINALIMISKSFGFGLIVEGIETQEQSDYLLKLGCAQHQGFLYSKPMRLKDFEKWICNFK